MTIAKWLTIATTAAFIGAAPGAQAAEGKSNGKTFNTKQKGEIRRLVRDYLIKHPEVIVEAMQEYRRRQTQQREQRAQAAIKDNRLALLQDKHSVVAGNPKGNVTIVEFFDYRCGYCKAVKPQLDKVLKKDRNIRVVYKEFPILGPVSTYASRAAIASRKQGDDMYRKYHDALMVARQLSPAIVMTIAKRVGLDTDKLAKDMNDPSVTEVIRLNHALAQRLGIRGTPAFVIGNEMVPGAIGTAQFAAKVEAARAACKKAKATVC